MWIILTKRIYCNISTKDIKDWFQIIGRLPITHMDPLDREIVILTQPNALIKQYQNCFNGWRIFNYWWSIDYRVVLEYKLESCGYMFLYVRCFDICYVSE
jgi:hypothetical protein